MAGEEEIFRVFATIHQVRIEDNPTYSSCSNVNCKKKVILGLNSTYNCFQCNNTSTNCIKRYILPVRISDTTMSKWATAFDEVAQTLMGTSADNFEASTSEARQTAAQGVLLKEFDMTCRVTTTETHRGVINKFTIIRLKPLDKISYINIKAQDLINATINS